MMAATKNTAVMVLPEGVQLFHPWKQLPAGYDARKQDWYRQAAEQGLFDGQLAMGRCYENGIGVEANGAEAVKWYRMAATGGSELGQYELARCCENGIGVPLNVGKAKHWYDKAAAKGHEKARGRAAALGERRE